MITLVLALISTVPYEYPYFEIARREVSFIPLPPGVDTSSYERRLYLEYMEDSLFSTVKGIMEERVASAVGEDARVHSDSARMEGDTTVLFSHFSFGFTKLDAGIIFMDMPLGKRVASRGHENMYSGEMILERLGLRQRGASCRGKSRCAVESGYGTGFARLNLVTGAVITLKLEPAKRTQGSPPPY